MDFRQLLDQMMQKFDDAEGIFLMGYDGIAVEKAVKDASSNLDMLAAEYTNLLRITKNALRDIEGGNLEEIMNITDTMIILIKCITHEYFLFMVLHHDANFGRARFELKKAHYLLQKELS
jgi:predicted regulator of Ras-like GTPase activity (Roadblock/LC7/MglB family)